MLNCWHMLEVPQRERQSINTRTRTITMCYTITDGSITLPHTHTTLVYRLILDGTWGIYTHTNTLSTLIITVYSTVLRVAVHVIMGHQRHRQFPQHYLLRHQE